MAKVQHVTLDEIIGYFDELEDPRSTINQKHPLVSVVVIAMMAVLAGAGGPTAIAEWAARGGDPFGCSVQSHRRGEPLQRRLESLLVAQASCLCGTGKMPVLPLLQA